VPDTRTHSPKRIAVAVGAVVACLALLVGAAAAGTRTPSRDAVSALSGTGSLDYSKDTGGRLRRLDPSFVAQSLGLSFPGSTPTAAAPGGGVTTTSGSVAAGPPINPVSTPVLPCVNGRQTADPLSPPCVAQFTGDNGGATYRGVSRNEVRVLIRMRGQITTYEESAPQILTPFDTLVDLGRPPAAPESYKLTKLRLYQEYFNRHYQTFGRRLHFFVYFDKYQASAVNWGSGEAADLIFRVHPFAVAELSTFDTDDTPFVDTFLGHGIAAFLPGLDLAERQRRNRELLWTNEPTLERLAEQYTSYICTKVVPEPTAWNGDPGQNGRPRRFGLYHGDSSAGPTYERLYRLTVERLRACGANIVADATFPNPAGCGIAEAPAAGNPPFDSSTPPKPYAIDAITRFRAAGVTTVLWPGCPDFNIGPASLQLNYRPEWILAGDGLLDDAAFVPSDRASFIVFDHHAIVVTPAVLQPDLGRAQCYRAQREADPTLPQSYAQVVPPSLVRLGISAPPTQSKYEQARSGCSQYAPLRQLFTAVQLAGPHLTPATLATGLRSLDYFASPDPETPSCFYREDNSCVQDAIAEYWDLGKVCWRAIEGATRHLPGRWPRGNIDAEIHGDEPCNDGYA